MDSANRKFRRDLSEDFAEPYNDDVPAGRRGAGVRVRFRGLPATKWGRIFAAFGLLVFLGIGAGAFLMARSYLLHDERFVIPSSSAIEIEGNAHVTRAQLLGVFGGDVERNIFSVSLEQRRAELEKLPWVAHATVMRLLPDRMRVSILERTPVAFVRQGSRIGLVDANGVLLDMPVDQKEHYSFPVVTGIVASDPLSTRAARMKIFERFTSELDGSGEKISEELSEVDLSNPEDVQAMISGHSTEILVHFGEEDFLGRYQRFQQHLSEWKTLYPKLSSVDMRYDRQVVLQMPPGAAAAASNGGANADAPAPSGDARPVSAAPIAASAVVKSAMKASAKTVNKLNGATPAMTSAAAAKTPLKTAAKTPAKTPVKHSVAKSVVKGPTPVTARSEVAFAVPAKKNVPKSKAHKAAAKHPPSVVRHKVSNTHYHATQAVHP
ncbi:MAG: FtsQ-type POTRA domain-containing protein [Edaphobacter sp.]